MEIATSNAIVVVKRAIECLNIQNQKMPTVETGNLLGNAINLAMKAIKNQLLEKTQQCT